MDSYISKMLCSCDQNMSFCSSPYNTTIHVPNNISCDTLLISGDGDQRLRSIQMNGSFCVKTASQSELSKLEYPPVFYFNKTGDFPMQDICHVLKKLVNCLHYLSTRFIIMADSDSIEDTKFTLNWGMILKLATESEEFRDCIPYNSAAL